MQPAALPAPDDHGTDLKNNRTPQHGPRLPFPAARSSGSRPVTSRTPPAPPAAAGLRPVLDPPGRSPRTWQLPGNSRRQSRTPATPPEPLKPPLTRPRFFRDEDLHERGGRPDRQYLRRQQRRVADQFRVADGRDDVAGVRQRAHYLEPDRTVTGN